jgi:hypothetical protein
MRHYRCYDQPKQGELCHPINTTCAESAIRDMRPLRYAKHVRAIAKLLGVVAMVVAIVFVIFKLFGWWLLAS